MSKTAVQLNFNVPDLGAQLSTMNAAELDSLDFGVIGFDASTAVRQYNDFESKLAGLSKDRVIGHLLFTSVAPCMNNFMVAQRFEDALRNRSPLDIIVDYVFTLRMRPVRVRLRLMSCPDALMRYVLVERKV